MTKPLFLFLAALLFCLGARAQTPSRTYYPLPKNPKASFYQWNVEACGAQEFPAGQLYSELAGKGVTPLFASQAQEALGKVGQRGFWGKVASDIPYAVAGGAALLNLSVVKANLDWTKALNVANGALGVVLPFAKAKASALPSWASLLPKDSEEYKVGEGACQAVVVLTKRGGPGFTVTLGGGGGK